MASSGSSAPTSIHSFLGACVPAEHPCFALTGLESVAGLPCDDHSLCNGRNKLCIARGPAWPDNFKSNEIIAQRQADKARELLTSAAEEVTGTFGPVWHSTARTACTAHSVLMGRRV